MRDVEVTGADTEAGWMPPACTLPSDELPLRQAEFDDLFRAAVQLVERPDPTHLVLGLRPAPGRTEAVRGLTRRETQCCSFFAFTVIEGGGLLRLKVRVPSNRAGVLDAVAERAARLSGSVP